MDFAGSTLKRREKVIMREWVGDLQERGKSPAALSARREMGGMLRSSRDRAGGLNASADCRTCASGGSLQSGFGGS